MFALTHHLPFLYQPLFFPFTQHGMKHSGGVIQACHRTARLSPFLLCPFHASWISFYSTRIGSSIAQYIQHSRLMQARWIDTTLHRSLQGAYGQRRLGSKLKTRSQPQDAMASLHSILNPGVSNFGFLDPNLTMEMGSARTSGLAAISSE